MGLQRGDGGARGRGERHPADLRGRPRDRLDADRSRRRCARADADQGRRVGGAEVFRAHRADGQARPAPRHRRASGPRRHARAPARRRPRAAAPQRPAGPAAAALRCGRPAPGPGAARQHARARPAAGALRRRACSRGCWRRGSPTRASGSMRWAAGPTPRWHGRIGAATRQAGARRRASRPAADRRAHRPLQRARWLCWDGARGSACWRTLDRRRRHLDACAKLLASLGYQGVLQRGYALVRDSEGRTLRSAAQIAAGQRLDIELADGHVDAQALCGGGASRGAEPQPPDAHRSRGRKTQRREAAARARCFERFADLNQGVRHTGAARALSVCSHRVRRSERGCEAG